MAIFPVTESIFPVIFSIFSGKSSDNTGLIDIFPGSQNNFSGLIILKLSRLLDIYRNVWSLIYLSDYQFDSFVETLPRISETAGKISKRYSDRNEEFLDKFKQILRETCPMQLPRCSWFYFGHCPIKSRDVKICPHMSNNVQFCPMFLSNNVWKYPIKSRHVKICQALSNFVQKLPVTGTRCPYIIQKNRLHDQGNGLLIHSNDPSHFWMNWAVIIKIDKSKI